MDEPTPKPFPSRKPGESEDAAGERLGEELRNAADADAGEEPPLRCDHCGEPIGPSEEYKAVTRSDPETGEPLESLA